MPYCSDLMVRFSCLAAGPDARIGAALSKYGTTYRAEVRLSSGKMVISRQRGQQRTELASMPLIQAPAINEETPVRFANVDHQLTFEYGGTKLTYDLGRNPEDAGPISRSFQPGVEIFGTGRLTLSHIAVFRDIHYTERQHGSSGVPGRATEEPFVLGEDEFFVLGDNSPNSEDCRWWHRRGIANKGLNPYRMFHATIWWARRCSSIGRADSNLLHNFHLALFPMLAGCVLSTAAQTEQNNRR
jgi:hypothetical protein